MPYVKGTGWVNSSARKRGVITPRPKRSRTVDAAAWRQRNPDKVRAANQRKGTRESYKKWLSNNADRRKLQARTWQLKKYGLTIESFAALEQQQECRCANCGKVVPLLDVDHDHTTNKVRGLLCRECNTGIGLLGDTLDGLRNAVAYLERAQ